MQVGPLKQRCNLCQEGHVAHFCFEEARVLLLLLRAIAAV
jgi:hypothetical protein